MKPPAPWRTINANPTRGPGNSRVIRCLTDRSPFRSSLRQRCRPSRRRRDTARTVTAGDRLRRDGGNLGAKMPITAMLIIALAAQIVAAGTTFRCTLARVWDGDGPVWCAEGPRVLLAGIALWESDGTCRPNQHCPAASAEQAKLALDSLVDRRTGTSRGGHALVSGPALTCRGRGARAGRCVPRPRWQAASGLRTKDRPMPPPPPATTDSIIGARQSGCDRHSPTRLVQTSGCAYCPPATVPEHDYFGIGRRAPGE